MHSISALPWKLSCFPNAIQSKVSISVNVLCTDEAHETPFLLQKRLCFNVGERVDEEKVRARGSYFFLTEWEGLLIFFTIYCYCLVCSGKHLRACSQKWEVSEILEEWKCSLFRLLKMQSILFLIASAQALKLSGLFLMSGLSLVAVPLLVLSLFPFPFCSSWALLMSKGTCIRAS